MTAPSKFENGSFVRFGEGKDDLMCINQISNGACGPIHYYGKDLDGKSRGARPDVCREPSEDDACRIVAWKLGVVSERDGGAKHD